MSSTILLKLKSRLAEIESFLETETKRNVLKEELQFYVLDFIYHHIEYSHWTMYGGSSLRICHKLDRMSVDLDFEITNECTKDFLLKIKSEIEKYFKDTHNTDESILTVKVSGTRGLLLVFDLGDDIQLGSNSNQVHVKIDLNTFSPKKVSIEKIPINRDQFSFVIKTYSMSTLMASKIAAILLRGERGIGKEIFEEKGRDIYDLLWYMKEQIIPDLDYLRAKNVDMKDLHHLFDTLIIKMNKVNDKNLENDLKPLFINSSKIDNWLINWRMTFMNLIKSYSIYRTTILKEVIIHQEFLSGNYSFKFYFDTEEKKAVGFIITISKYWTEDKKGEIDVEKNENLESHYQFISENYIGSKKMPEDRLKQYATIFYKKITEYLAKTNNEVIGEIIQTKVLRMTADNLNQNEQIVLTKSTLLHTELDNLFK